MNINLKPKIIALDKSNQIKFNFFSGINFRNNNFKALCFEVQDSGLLKREFVQAEVPF